MNTVRAGHVEVERGLIHIHDYGVWEVVSFSQCSEVVDKPLQLVLQLCWQFLLDARLSSAKYQQYQHIQSRKKSVYSPDRQGVTTHELVHPTIGGLEARASFRKHCLCFELDVLSSDTNLQISLM